MGIEENILRKKIEEFKVGTFLVPDFIGKTKKEMKDLLKNI